MARMLACLRTFYDYFLRRGGIDSNPVRQVRTPRLDKKLPSFLEEDEVVRLLEATTGDSFTDRRGPALLVAIFGGGLRPRRRDKKLPSFLEEDEVVRLLEATTGDSFTDRRDRALLETIYGGGLRVSEATGLDLTDLQLDQGFAVVRGKGGKERLAPLGTEATRGVEEYL